MWGCKCLFIFYCYRVIRGGGVVIFFEVYLMYIVQMGEILLGGVGSVSAQLFIGTLKLVSK